MTKSGGGGQFALASPRSKYWKDLSPLSVPPVIYAHVFNEPKKNSVRCPLASKGTQKQIVTGYRPTFIQ